MHLVHLEGAAVHKWPRWITGSLLDGFWLVGLMLYVIAGVSRVPFHGDESTLIDMSRDYFYLAQAHDLDRVFYRQMPEDPAEQQLRILNGTVGKMAMGLAWDMAGLTADDLNAQWDWGMNWDQNVALGHMPGDRLLRAARLSSALFTAISVAAVFGIARRVAGNRAAAWAASLVYATTPAVLLNGRRAMMEGSTLCFTALTLLAAVMVVRPGLRKRAGWVIALGLLGGCAVASKHIAAAAVVTALAAVWIAPLIRQKKAPGFPFGWRHTLQVVGAGGLVILTFLAWNPAWWSDLPGMPGRVLAARRDLLNGQVAWYGGYHSGGDRMEALVRQAFFAGPQFYEVSAWKEYIGGPIADYRGSWLAGRGGGMVEGVLLAAAFLIGLAALCTRWREGPSFVMLVWLIGTALALLALTPLEWQRYYLPIQAPVAVAAGIGVGQGVRWGRVLTRRRSNLPAG